MIIESLHNTMEKLNMPQEADQSNSVNYMISETGSGMLEISSSCPKDSSNVLIYNKLMGNKTDTNLKMADSSLQKSDLLNKQPDKSKKKIYINRKNFYKLVQFEEQKASKPAEEPQLQTGADKENCMLEQTADNDIMEKEKLILQRILLNNQHSNKILSSLHCKINDENQVIDSLGNLLRDQLGQPLKLSVRDLYHLQSKKLISFIK